jgi:hypothetical protein
MARVIHVCRQCDAEICGTQPTANNSVSPEIALIKSIAFRIRSGEIKMGCLHGLKQEILSVAQRSGE